MRLLTQRWSRRKTLPHATFRQRAIRRYIALYGIVSARFRATLTQAPPRVVVALRENIDIKDKLGRYGREIRNVPSHDSRGGRATRTNNRRRGVPK